MSRTSQAAAPATASTKPTELGSMRRVSIGKVVLNIGVGKSGEAVERASKVLQQLTGQKPSQRKAKESIRDFGVHKGEPIGLKVTIRGAGTKELIARLLAAREKKMAQSCFDDRGSISFGLKEHIEIPGTRYDPEIGIWGMNVSVLLERPGGRVSRRLHKPAHLGRRHVVAKDEAMSYFRDQFGVAIE